MTEMENLNPSQNAMNLMPEPFIQKIVLADDTELLGTGGEDYDGNELWLWISSPIDFIQAATIFSNPDRIVKIIVKISEYNTKVYNNYIVLGLIQRRTDGKMAVRLTRAS